MRQKFVKRHDEKKKHEFVVHRNKYAWKVNPFAMNTVAMNWTIIGDTVNMDYTTTTMKKKTSCNFNATCQISPHRKTDLHPLVPQTIWIFFYSRSVCITDIQHICFHWSNRLTYIKRIVFIDTEYRGSCAFGQNIYCLLRTFKCFALDIFFFSLLLFSVASTSATAATTTVTAHLNRINASIQCNPEKTCDTHVFVQEFVWNSFKMQNWGWKKKLCSERFK